MRRSMLLAVWVGLGCGGAPPRAPSVFRAGLSIARVELNQAIGVQHDGAAKFVAGKDTAVLAYLSDPVAPSEQSHKAVVRRDGVEVATLVPTPSPQPSDVLVFQCSSREACGHWQKGAYEVEVTIDGVTASASATFVERRRLRILGVPLRAKYGTTDADIRVPDDKWKRGADFTRATYPVAHDGFKFELRDALDVSQHNLLTDEGQRAVWQALSDLNPPSCATNPQGPDCYDVIKGFVKSRIGDMQGYTMGMPAGVTVNDDEDMPATVAHEIAHPFGVGDEYKGGSYHCAVNPTPPDFVGKDWNNRENASFRCADSKEQAFAAKSGRNGDGTFIDAKAVHPFDAEGRGRLGDAICFMGSGAVQGDNWISPRVYDRLFDQLAPVASTRATGVVLAVEGTLFKKAGGGHDVEAAPWFHYEGPLPAVPASTSTFFVRAVDAAGQTLSQQNLEVSFSPDIDPPRTLDFAAFDTALALPPSTARLEIVEGATVLKQVVVTPGKPVVAFTGLVPGSELRGEQTLRWTGTDPDGDALAYNLEYSDDDGKSFSVLAAELRQAEWTENFDELPGGDRARFRLSASDGVNTTVVTSEPVKVPPKAPEVFVDSPEPGTTLAAGASVALEGGAYDLQDGWVSDERLVWSSDKDGVLGRGESQQRVLTAGSHVLTLSATTARGQSATRSVTVVVQEKAAQPEAAVVPRPAQGLACEASGGAALGALWVALLALSRRQRRGP